MLHSASVGSRYNIPFGSHPESISVLDFLELVHQDHQAQVRRIFGQRLPRNEVKGLLVLLEFRDQFSKRRCALADIDRPRKGYRQTLKRIQSRPADCDWPAGADRHIIAPNRRNQASAGHR